MIGIERILLKISGDLTENQEVLNGIKKEAENKAKLIDVIYGFGTKLSKSLNEADIEFSYKNGIRETTEEGLNIALRISEEVKNNLREEFTGYNIKLISPIKIINGNVENTNADEIFMKLVNKYNKGIVYSLEGRNKDKFKTLKNVEIRYIK